LSAKGFKIKLSDLVDQLKTMRYTVQKTRNISKNTFYVKNLVKQPQTFKEAYLNSSLQGKIADQKSEKDYTHNLFNQRYKKLYYNYFGLKNEQSKNFSFR
jgi:nicotinamide mononucleotide adenylyltransferase